MKKKKPTTADVLTESESEAEGVGTVATAENKAAKKKAKKKGSKMGKKGGKKKGGASETEGSDINEGDEGDDEAEM